MLSPEISRELALHLRHNFGELLDLPLLLPAPGDGKSDSVARPAAELAACREETLHCERCPFHIGRRKSVFGRGAWNARIAFVGDFPSLADDEAGEPFSGEEGRLLDRMILAMRLRPEEIYLTQLFKCRPPEAEERNATSYRECLPFLERQFRVVEAPWIVALGEPAARVFARSESPLGVLRRQVFEWNGRQVIPTHHPRDLLRNPALKREAWDDLQNLMRRLEGKAR